MNHGSLFSGIGGFDLAAEWAGWTNIFHCEINPFGQKILKHYWPDAIQLGNITKAKFYKDGSGRLFILKSGITADTISFRQTNEPHGVCKGAMESGENIIKSNTSDPLEDKEREYTWIQIPPIDVLSGGFPCQPFSLAGKRKGTEDDRHLFPEMLRTIREIQPTWVVGENVFGIVNWSGGLVFEQVQADLENEGYEVQAYILPACGKNAPHRRDRVWFVAHATDNRNRIGFRDDGNGEKKAQDKQGVTRFEFRRSGESGITPDTKSEGLERKDESGDKERGMREHLRRNTSGFNWKDVPNPNGRGFTGEEHGQTKPGINSKYGLSGNWDNFPTQPPVRGRNDELPGILDRNIKPEIYGQISERYTDKDLQEMWEAIQSEDIQWQIGRLYKIHEPGILFQVMQLCTHSNKNKKGLSPFSEKASEKLLRKMRKYGTFANSPQGRKLEKQFTQQFGNTLPYLSHEVALVAMEVTRAAKAFITWHRNESIKAYGNAIVPQIAYEIFKAINEYEINL